MVAITNLIMQPFKESTNISWNCASQGTRFTFAVKIVQCRCNFITIVMLHNYNIMIAHSRAASNTITIFDHMYGVMQIDGYLFSQLTWTSTINSYRFYQCPFLKESNNVLHFKLLKQLTPVINVFFFKERSSLCSLYEAYAKGIKEYNFAVRVYLTCGFAGILIYSVLTTLFCMVQIAMCCHIKYWSMTTTK